MTLRRMRLRDVVHRAWLQRCGEQRLVITFWPQDYRRGAVYEHDGHRYRITRYLRAGDARFYEVWGRQVRARVDSIGEDTPTQAPGQRLSQAA